MRRKIYVFACLFFTSFILFNNLRAQDMAVTIANSRINSVSVTAALQKPIRGTVTDEKGTGISGVSITVNGTSIGTVTDGKGAFSLTVPDENANDSLLVSSIGYEEQVIAIGNQSVINIRLLQNVSTLNQVVVVGYGTQRRTSVTAAIASVPMKEIKDMPVSNVATALQGKIPGIVVQQNNGTPGSTPAIKVRGLGSISAGNSPLIVVDGNIVSANIFGLLNSNEIQSIDVLKDASSTAIYGSRGSNGVIIVTTKRGRNGKTNVSLDVFTGYQEISRKIDLLNSQQFAELSKDAANNAYLDNVVGAKITDANNVRPVLRQKYPRGDLFDWFNFDDPTKIANLPYNDFQDMIFRKGKISNYQLTASGGTDKVQFVVSGGYLKQDGIIKKSTLDRYTIRASVDAKVSDKLKVGLSINPSYKIQQEVTSNGHWADNGIINAALSAAPMSPIYAADGTTYSSETALAAPYNWPGITNPIANITEYNSEYVSTNILGSSYVEYSLMKDLKYRASANVNLNANRRNAYRSSAIVLNQLLPPNLAIGNAFSDQGMNWLFNQTLDYNKTFGDDHNFDVLVGMEAYKFNYQSSNASGSTFANDIVQTLNAAGLPTAVTSFKTQNATKSFFARLGYNYKEKYLLNASIRRDGSSIFGPESRWGTFPAGSVGWRLTKESFMENVTAISEAKLRVSYGLAGNNAFSNDYPYVASVGADNYSFNNNLVTGLAPSSLGNAKLGWERSNQVDIGLDLGLFNDRIYLLVDYYKRNTKDLLLSVNVPTLTGFSTAFKTLVKWKIKAGNSPSIPGILPVHFPGTQV